MSALAEGRFWIAFVAVFALLSAAGIALSRVVVPAPSVYHRTSFLEFPLPEGWSCDRQGTETVCSPIGQRPVSAIIIFTVKWRGPDDGWTQYLDHVRQPQRPSFDPDAALSEVMSAGETVLDGRRWVDARHRNSEIKGYETRYLATITSNLGVLVTYSIHRDHIETYEAALDAAVRGLVIYEQPSVLN